MARQTREFGSALSRTGGDAGAGITNTFGNRGRIGATAEQATATMLLELAREYEELFVLHGLKLPGYNWDIDHLVIYRNTMIIVDDKQWRSDSTYYLTREGDHTRVLRDGEQFGGNELHPNYYRGVLAEFMPKRRVESVVVLHGERQQITWASWRAHIPLLRSSELEAYLRRQFERGGRRVKAAKQFQMFETLLPYTREVGQAQRSPGEILLLLPGQHTKRSAIAMLQKRAGYGSGWHPVRLLLRFLLLAFLVVFVLPFLYTLILGVIQLLNHNY